MGRKLLDALIPIHSAIAINKNEIAIRPLANGINDGINVWIKEIKVSTPQYKFIELIAEMEMTKIKINTLPILGT